MQSFLGAANFFHTHITLHGRHLCTSAQSLVSIEPNPHGRKTIWLFLRLSKMLFKTLSLFIFRIIHCHGLFDPIYQTTLLVLSFSNNTLIQLTRLFINRSLSLHINIPAYAAGQSGVNSVRLVYVVLTTSCILMSNNSN